MTAAPQYHSHLLTPRAIRPGNYHEQLKRFQEDPKPHATFVTSSCLRLPICQALTMGAVGLTVSPE